MSSYNARVAKLVKQLNEETPWNIQASFTMEPSAYGGEVPHVKIVNQAIRRSATITFSDPLVARQLIDTLRKTAMFGDK